MVLAVQHSNRDSGIYAIFDEGKKLRLYDAAADCETVIAALPEIGEMPLRLYFHHPYVCVSERFGLLAAVVHIETGAVRNFSREDYHSDVSSYSIGFLEREGKILLLHQTQWNRLDITDLETGELLTEREVYIRETKPGYKDENGKWIPRETDQKNYLDYFHSLLHVSPNYTAFLSNGWVWAPWDNVRCFSVEAFLRNYEPGSQGIEFGHGYNWDRPCAFIDDDCFVIAADDLTAEDDLPPESYHQLQFFRLSDRTEAERWLASCKQVKSDVFPLSPEESELFGDLWYDEGLGQLIALSSKGATGLDLDGRTLWHKPEIIYTPQHVFDCSKDAAPTAHVWQYSPEHHLFYRYDHDRRTVETTGITDQPARPAY